MASPLARRTLVLLFFIALIPRIALLAELGGSQYFDYPSVDEEEYRLWATEIAEGRAKPEVFYGSPVYPYFLGSIFRVFGTDLFLPRVVQAILGAARAPLTALAGALVFGPAIGVIAGIFVGIYWTTLFYDVFLLKECLALFLQDAALLALIVALAHRSGRTASARLLLGTGFLIGLAALAREFLAPFILLAAALVVWRVHRHFAGRTTAWRRALVAGLIVIVGAAGALVPVALRNLVVGGEFVLLSSQGGQNFYLGNNSANTAGIVTFPTNIRSDPLTLQQDFRALASFRTGRTLGPSEASTYWMNETLREMGEDPMRAVTLLGRKALLSVSAFEVPNVLAIEYFARITKTLAWNPIRWQVVLPLALVGIVVALRRDRDRDRLDLALAPLLILATVFFALIAFYVSDRYRLPAVAPLALFAAAGLVSLARAVRSVPRPSLARAAPVVIGLGVVVVVMHLPLLPSASRGDAMPPANLANSLAKDGRYEDAIARYEEAFEIEPDTDFALYGIAMVYADNGRYPEAIEHFKKYVRKNPLSSHGYYNLGTTYFEMGHPDTAIMAFENAIRIEPYYAEAHFNLGAVKQRLDDLEGARVSYEAAVGAAPGLFRAWNNLGTVLVRLGDTEAAMSAFERALGDTTYVEPHVNIAGLWLERGEGARAALHYEWILARQRRLDALLGLGKARALTGDGAAARDVFETYLRVAPPNDPTRAEVERRLANLG